MDIFVQFDNRTQAIEWLEAIAARHGLKVVDPTRTPNDEDALTPCPTGYETIVGYLTRKGYGSMPIEYQADLGRRMSDFCRMMNLDVTTVDAPRALHKDHSGRSITSVNAYHTHALDYVLGTLEANGHPYFVWYKNTQAA